MVAVCPERVLPEEPNVEVNDPRWTVAVCVVAVVDALLLAITRYAKVPAARTTTKIADSNSFFFFIFISLIDPKGLEDP
jgi:hypothetical protein